MNKSNKIKSLLALRGIKSAEFSKALGLSKPQALNTKYIRESFTSDDLIQLAELTNTQLSFVDKETGNVLISFDSNDIKKDTQ